VGQAFAAGPAYSTGQVLAVNEAPAVNEALTVNQALAVMAPRGRNAQRSDAGRVPSGDSFHRWSFEGRPG
jgi:hypothetical protein